MESSAQSKRLIVTADDFGCSREINEAVSRAHREGILTCASLMVNGTAFAEAVALARENPRLGVGLHLTLLQGRATLSPKAIPGLVDGEGKFRECPVAAGCAYFFRRSLREQVRREIRAQFEKFRATGLPLDHVNGHLHMHLHPTVVRILTDDAGVLGLRHMRLTREPLRLDLRIASGNWHYRLSHATIFHWLGWRARPLLARQGVGHTQRVFGLLQNARVTEPYLLKLLPRLPPGDSELYSHPSLSTFRHELDALISPRVKAQIKKLGVKLIRYQDL